MQNPVQVTFRDLPVNDTIEQLCLEEAEKLERHHDRITSCKVVVAQPHRNQEKGNAYEVRIDVIVPGGEVVVNRVPPEHPSEETLETAVREGFRKMRRRLEDFVQRQRGEVKSHD